MVTLFWRQHPLRAFGFAAGDGEGKGVICETGETVGGKVRLVRWLSHSVPGLPLFCFVCPELHFSVTDLTVPPWWVGLSLHPFSHTCRFFLWRLEWFLFS